MKKQRSRQKQDGGRNGAALKFHAVLLLKSCRGCGDRETRSSDPHGVCEGDGRRDDEDAILEHRKIARFGGVYDQRSDARPGEHRFHHHRAADDDAHLQADDGNDRNERIAQAVLEDDDDLGYTL